MKCSSFPLHEDMFTLKLVYEAVIKGLLPTLPTYLGSKQVLIFHPTHRTSALLLPAPAIRRISSSTPLLDSDNHHQLLSTSHSLTHSLGKLHLLLLRLNVDLL